MNGTILSKEDRSMLLEMTSRLFFGEFSNFIIETQMLTKNIIRGLVQDTQIHWFEFVVKHLAPKIFIDQDGDTLPHYLDSLFNYYYPNDKDCSLIKHIYLNYKKNELDKR